MFKSINKNTLVAGLFFFCVLYSLFVMRPFRSAMAAQIGTSDLTYFLLIVVLVMLLANPIGIVLLRECFGYVGYLVGAIVEYRDNIYCIGAC